MTKEESQAALIGIVQEEVTRYQDGQYWITDKVAFNMREMIREFRKNYWGIYDVPVDPITKREKMWVPMTRTLCDAVRKSVNPDPKDVRFRSTDPDYVHITHIVRGAVRRYLYKTYFNFSLNQLITGLVIDGTQVWKTYESDGNIVRKEIDLLNVSIDPKAESIQQAYRFTERSLLTKSEVAAMDWEHKDDFHTKTQLSAEKGGQSTLQGEYGDVYEMWGKVPKKYITLNDEDEGEIDAHVVVSGFDSGQVLFHLAEENKTKDTEGTIIKPYEEAWYLKVPGRWYGVGIAETVMPLQWWVNSIVNLRINKNTIAQLGLLKIRKGAGVTQQMIQNLIAKGVITLTDPAGDIQQLDISESGQSSYEDEKIAKQWSQELTSVFDATLGNLPASTSATGAVIQDRQSASAFTLVNESVEHFIQRWINRHVMPHVPMLIEQDKKITIFKDFDNIKQIRETVLANIVSRLLEEQWENTGIVPTEMELQSIMQRAQEKLERRGDLLTEVVEEIILDGIATEVTMTNTEVDVAVTVRNLLELRNGMPPDAAADMTAQALDLLGLQVPASLKNPPQNPMQEQGAPMPALNTQQITTEANTLTNEQR